MKLSELKAGDRIKGFEGFGCIPDRAIRVVCDGPSGMYVKCREGTHMLDGQEGEDGDLIGLSRA